MLDLFETRSRREKDERELKYLYNQYGDKTRSILRKRVQATIDNERDCRHWRRLLRKSRKFEP
ncbi:MAG: hypothetical protein AAGE37_09965 [Pseudomonadota bacterium]